MMWKLRLRRHFYRSSVDGAMEPYCVYSPKGARRAASLPLVILLHGYGGDERGGIGERTAALADRYGMLLLSLRGRGNSFYDRQAEEDFFRGFESACERYKVDRDRVYLMGTSMGGTGVWRLATRFPHLFAAAVPICGWTHSPLWYRKWYGPGDHPDEVAACMRPLLADADSLAAAANMVHIPTFVLHGARDETVSVEHSRRMVAALRRLGGRVVYREYARSGHQGFRSRWDSIFRWFGGADAVGWERGKRRRFRGDDRPLRRMSGPRAISYATHTLRHRRAYWVELDALDKTFQRAAVEIEWRQGEARVKTENVEALTLCPPPELLAETGRMRVRIGRVLVYDREPVPRLSFARQDDVWRPTAAPARRVGCRKRMGLEGPIADVFTNSFRIVVGDGDEDRAEAERFRGFWRGWMLPKDKNGKPRGKIPMLTAKQARRETSANLMLFGCVETHSLIREVAADLPIAPRLDGVQFGEVFVPGAGLFMAIPDPRTTDRYLLILHRHFPWRMKDLEGLPCLLPDYVVFDPKAALRRSAHSAWEAFQAKYGLEPGDGDDLPEDARPLRYLPDGWLRAGFFDERWGLPGP